LVAAVLRRCPAVAHGAQELVDLTEALLERDDLRGLLIDEILTEAVLAVHLEDEAAEVANLLLADTEQAPALAAKLSRRRESSPARCSRRRALVGSSRFLRARVAEAVDE
jgi:hypothetical protein